MDLKFIFGHGFAPESLDHAEQTYIAAWRWRASNHDSWLSIVRSAHDLAAQGERVRIRRLIADRAPQRYAPIIARWLIGEHPQLLPAIETRRSVFDLYAGCNRGGA